MKKSLTIVMIVLLALLAIACSPEHTHKFVKDESKTDVEASCTQNGIKYLICSCGLTDTEITPAKGHTEVTKVMYPATCEQEGTAYVSCSVCDQFLKYVVLPVDPNGHATDNEESAGTWVTGKAGTCTTKGTKTLTCKYCGESYTKEMYDKSNHGENKTKQEVREATMFTAKQTVNICLGCGEPSGTPTPTPGSYNSVVGTWVSEIIKSTDGSNNTETVYYINLLTDAKTVTGAITAEITKTEKETVIATGAVTYTNTLLEKFKTGVCSKTDSTTVEQRKITLYENNSTAQPAKDITLESAENNKITMKIGNSNTAVATVLTKTSDTAHKHDTSALGSDCALDSWFDSENHYINCKTLGLDHIAVNHDNSCTECGFSDLADISTVNIKDSSGNILRTFLTNDKGTFELPLKGDKFEAYSLGKTLTVSSWSGDAADTKKMTRDTSEKTCYKMTLEGDSQATEYNITLNYV